MPVVDVKHVALVGFMGAGKSTLGRRLAGRIRAALTDVDADLEDQFGPIPDYFEKHGEAAFRTVEESAVTDALSRGTRSVVVLGGGAVTSAATRRLPEHRRPCPAAGASRSGVRPRTSASEGRGPAWTRPSPS